MRRFLIATLLLSILISLIPASGTLAQGIPDYRFGVVEAYDAPAAARALGAGWTRVTFRWNEIQPSGPDEWNVVPISDQALNSELVQGRQVVGLLVTTPGWATDVGIGPGVPKGLYLPHDDPNNLWANFVRSMVGRYAGRIDHWIIWNEPDIPDTQHMSWGGSIDDFIRLLQVAYAVAKETNPNAVIHMAAVTHWWNEHWYNNFLDQLVVTPGAAESNYFFDIATLHIYFQPETVYDITAHYYRLLRNHNLNKPIWIAETNAAPSQDPTWPVPNPQFNISLDEQAAFIIQAFSLGIAAGAERMAVYKMIDTESDRAANPEPFGLVRMDGSRRPAFTAYQVATNYLSGFRSGTWDRRDELSVVTIDRGGKTTTVAWSRNAEPQTAAIAARTTRALVVDMRGSTHYVYPDHGYYFIDLPGANCAEGCLIGGAPLLLIEEAPSSADTAPPPASPTPLPMTSESTPPDTTITPDANAMPTPTPSFTPTPTPTPSSTPTASPTPTITPTPTTTPSPTPTQEPTTTPSPTFSPTPTPIPVPMSEVPPRRPWVLVGALAIGMGSAAFAIDQREHRTQLLWRQTARRQRLRAIIPEHWGNFLLLVALMIVLLLISRGLFL